jgi:hypothetical protein
VGRLENIIARNRRGNRPRERVVVSLTFGAIVLLILALMVFTDLGRPPEAGGVPAGDTPAAVTPARHHKHVDGVLLRRPPRSTPPARAPAPAAETAARP